MSAEVEIVGKCICGNSLNLEIDYVDDDIVLAVKPCSVCIEQAMRELVWSVDRGGFFLLIPEHGDKI